jgi:hypothetical protein
MKKYIISGKTYDPIKVGDIGDFDEGCDKDHTCHDCGYKRGEIHMAECDAQRCPACGMQFITCNCDVIVHDTETNRKKFLDKSKYYLFMENYEKYMEVQKIKKNFEDEM